MTTGDRKMKPDIQAEFSRLMSVDPNKLLKPKAVVEAAEAPTSPLHHFFTWDDNLAAEKWRLWEARDLIASFTVYSEEVNTDVRVLVNLPEDRKHGEGYRWTTEVMARPDLREQYVEAALADLNRVRTKYQHVERLNKAWDVIDEVNEEVIAEISEKEKKVQRKTSTKKVTKETITPKKEDDDRSSFNGFVARSVTA